MLIKPITLSNNIKVRRESFAPHIISNIVWFITRINILRCSRHLFVRTISTNPHVEIITQIFHHFDQIAETQTISSFRNSLNTSKDFRLMFHLVNTHIYLNPQWRIQNNDINYLLKYYTPLCRYSTFCCTLCLPCWKTTHHYV